MARAVAAEVAEVTSAGAREVVGTAMAGEAGANMEASEVREGAGAVMGAAVCWSKRLAVEWLRRRRPEPPTSEAFELPAADLAGVLPPPPIAAGCAGVGRGAACASSSCSTRLIRVRVAVKGGRVRAGVRGRGWGG